MQNIKHTQLFSYVFNLFYNKYLAPQQTAEEIAASELENIPIEEFFDSNDGFDDLILSAEANVPLHNPTTNNTTSTVTNTRQETTINDDLASAFNDDNDDIFADIQWGTGNQIISSSLNHNATRNHDERLTSNVDLEDSFLTLLRDENASNDDDYVWGSAAKNARLSQTGPPSKKTKVHQIESINDDSYSWGSDSRTNTEASVAIKCSGCHQPAKE